MSQTIKLKRSAVTGNVPTTAQLELGEVAINTYDGKLFIKKDDGTASVIEVGSAPAGYNNTDWDTAYGWGDHALAGYLTSLPSHTHTIANVTGLQTALNGKVDDSQVLTNVPSGAVFTDTVYSLPEATATARGGIELFSNTDQTVTANAVSTTAGRTYGLQLNSAGQAVVNVPWSDTNTVYTHPSHPGDDISIDTGPLSGATVISDLDFNVTTDTLGHVTDANATISTRNLTAANIGAAPASHTHDDRYYTETESDSRFVNATGDTVTGNLTLSGAGDAARLTVGGSRLISVSGSSDVVWQNLGQLRFSNRANYDWNDWAGIKYDSANLIMTIGGPAAGVFSSNTNPSNIDIDFNGVTNIKHNGTTVIDSARNLTNIGTISAAGSISVSGYNSVNAYSGAFTYITGALTGNVVGNVTGNASTATKWATARTITLGGDLTGSVSIDGSANVTLSAQVSNDSHTHDGRYVNTTGDTMTGGLAMSGNNTVTFGPNSNWAGYLTIGGNANNSTTTSASIGTTNGNLHIDAANGSFATYLNFYDGTGGVTFGNGSGTVVAWMGNDGDLWKGSADNSGSKYWHASNDGSGSGLDADLLDGKHLAQIARYQSSSDFPNGTLVTTDIPSSASSGSSFVIEITGKAYGASRPHSVIAEGYLYNNTIINTAGTNLSGSNFTYLKVMNNGGYLSFWWPRHGYWNSYDVHVRDSSGGTQNYNRVTSITNSADPSGATKKIQINLATSWTSLNDGSGSGLDADLLDGQQGSYYAPASHNHSGVYLPVSGKAADSNLLDGIDSGSFLRSDATDYLNGIMYVRADIRNENAYRDHGVYGDYDSTKTNHIWSMGANYRSSAAGTNFGNLYGLAYKHTNNPTGGTMGGGHQMVWCSNGTPLGSLGLDRVWHAFGMRVGSSDVWHAGNDGAGSGLDADLLDGYNSAENGASVILRTASNGYLQINNWIHPANDTGLYYDNGTHYSSTGGGNMRLWNGAGSVYQSIRATDNNWKFLRLESNNGVRWDIATRENHTSGSLQFRPAGGDANNAWVSTTGYFASDNQGTLWGSSNDGSGSGLDADLLDGNQASYFYSPSNVGPSNSVSITGYGSGNFTYYQDSGTFNIHSGWHGYLISNHGDGSNYYRQVIALPFWGSPTHSRLEGGTQRGIYNMWTAENDGSGSGLDADLLDGVHGSGYVRTSAESNLNMSLYDITSVNDLTAEGTLRADTGYKVGSTTVIDGSRNATFNSMQTPTLKVGDGNDGYFYSDTNGRTAFRSGEFYIQSSVPTYYNYATNQYHGNSSGDNHYFRGNALSGNNWTISTVGAANFSGGVTSGNYVTATGNITANNGWVKSGSGGFYVSSNQIVDSGRNLLNIGNITCSGTNNTYGEINIREDMSSPGYTFMRFQSYSSGATLGSIYRQYGSMIYSTSSDYRLKENIVNLTGASDKIKSLPVRRFNFIEHPDRTVDGFLAHEVAAVVPEAVLGEKDAVDSKGKPVYQAIDQSKLVPLLTAGLQEALAEIEKLKARLSALEN